jgi:hypothetical protein
MEQMKFATLKTPKRRARRSDTSESVMPDSGQTGFKLDTQTFSKLWEKAQEAGESHHLIAKAIVTGALNEEVDVVTALVTLNAQMLTLREELALMTEILLTHAGKFSPEQAQKWTDENIKPAE